MKKSISLSVSVVAMLALGACGSGGGSDEMTFDEISNEGERLVNEFSDSTVTDPADLPTSGTASYSGVAGFGDNVDTDSIEGPDDYLAVADDLVVASELAMEADFASGDISGRMDNFRHYEEGEIDGSVAITNGTISNAGIEADLDGELSIDGDQAAVAGDLEGDFLDGEDGVAGTMNGSVGGVGLGGVFIGERD